jgi:predicted flap endonuclease-1-like 5' DNA nuclease/uncharacterized protein YlxW (UPF0749 family)
MDISTLFNQFDSQDSIAILFFMLIAFLFGLLVGYLLRSRKVNDLKRELKDKKKELSEAQAKVEALQDELALRDADLKRASFAVQEAESKAERIEQEKASLHKQVFQLNADLERQRSATQSFEAEALSLRQELTDMKSQPTKLAATIDEQDNSGAQWVNAHDARISRLEERLNQLAGENAALKGAVDNLQANTSGPTTEAIPPSSQPRVILPHDEMASSVHPMPGLPDASVIDEEPEQIFTQDKSVLSEKLVDEDVEKDDLTLIEGIGSFLERKLNEIGVYTYEEISTWDSRRVAEVTDAIGHFKGRIEKDRWVEQAATLTLKKQDEPETFTAPPQDAWTNDNEDLKIIEGIGPKIESLLKEAGIVNWDELADASIDLLKSVLDNAGPRYRMHDPETWPTQAQLAIRGEWKLLKEYQDELIGGRDLSS